MQLTAKRVATLVKRPGRYHDGHGLILVVVNPTNASWQLRYQRNGRERWLGLGPLPVDPTNPLSIRAMIRAVEPDPVHHFSRRRITTTGSLMKVYEGPAVIAERPGGAACRCASTAWSSHRSPVWPVRCAAALFPRIHIPSSAPG